ncbi:type II toxin-antitoxin system VapC family toxin [Rhizobium sp. PL01]|uniref:type II toxin-antitoxin system VapC family toxin n=1 Tax=Rhizobium sp. PL01 TaxID=3085631 RepID=UPI002980B542|nr:type II toxin-antitoxin system VapC family toxin [Rhizobium sp. PL01]MDW5312778.1 type II toxin-antitoxin system VapC family toxin [Rhizobium sp. PL01]
MYLLDTNVLSELRKVRKGQCDPAVLAWSQAVSPSDLFVSVITIFELEVGILLLERRDPVQAARMRLWMADQILPAFEDRVLNVELSTALICASLHVPDKRPERDGFIAATALQYDFFMVTRNTRDFEGTGVRLLNPWEA